MIYIDTYKCGHEGRIELFGKSEERDRKAAYEFSGICPECYLKQQISNLSKYGLATLNGSPKQIAWAEKIRANKLTEFDNLIAENKDVTDAKSLNQLSTFKAVVMHLSAKTDAVFWINNRNAVMRALYRIAIDEMDN